LASNRTRWWNKKVTTTTTVDEAWSQTARRGGSRQGCTLSSIFAGVTFKKFAELLDYSDFTGVQLVTNHNAVKKGRRNARLFAGAAAVLKLV
jgi:hypothetical protein